jgi:mono/diheme cytochrome c family protein
MKRTALSISFALALGAAACGSDGTATDAGVTADSGTTADAGTTADSGNTAPDPVAGQAVFTAQGCPECHGANGKMTPPGGDEPFTAPAVQAQTDTQLQNVIKSGKGSMPAYPNLTAKQLADVVAYIRQLATM